MYITIWLIRPSSRPIRWKSWTHMDPPHECRPEMISIICPPWLLVNISNRLWNTLALVLKSYDVTDLSLKFYLLGWCCYVISMLKKGRMQ